MFFASGAHGGTAWRGTINKCQHYQRLLETQRDFINGRQKIWRTGAYSELTNVYDCPATHFFLGSCESDPQNKAKHFAEATRLSNEYRPSLLRSACEYLNRHLTSSTDTVTQLRQQFRDVSPVEANEGLLTEVALGLLHCRHGQLDQACEAHDRFFAQHGAHPELALEIARVQLQHRQFSQAVRFAELAAADDKSRTIAYAISGQALLQLGWLAEAAEQFESAIQLSPAWIDIRVLLAHTYDAMGKPAESAAIQRDIVADQKRLTLISKQLST